MSIRCGDSRRGVGIAMDNESSRLLRKECAEILESMKVHICLSTQKALLVFCSHTIVHLCISAI